MKVLVTGSSGHLGEAIVRTLQQQGKHECVGMDIKPSPFTSLVGSVSSQKDVQRVMKGVESVIHTATLHKPHIVTHTYQDFIDTNVTGTLNLLEQAKRQQLKSFIFTSTTSAFGHSLKPKNDESAVWVTEETPPIPKNIYGTTKTAAEDLCMFFYQRHKLPCLILKTSRFFPEEDDRKELRESFEDANIKANELLFRRVDVADAVSAHLIAMEKAEEIGFSKYIISATSPFNKEHLKALRNEASSVIEKLFPEFRDIYDKMNWKMFKDIGRVYVNDKARRELDWQPKYDFKKCSRKSQDRENFLERTSTSNWAKGIPQN